MLTAALFTIAKTWKPQCPSAEERAKKTWHVYSGVRLGCKKMEILPFAATCVDLGMTIPSEVSQTKKDKYHVISLM